MGYPTDTSISDSDMLQPRNLVTHRGDSCICRISILESVAMGLDPAMTDAYNRHNHTHPHLQDEK